MPPNLRPRPQPKTNFKNLKNLQARLSQRSERLSAWNSAVCSWGVAGFVLAAALAASAARAAPGTLSPGEHFRRVAPLFAEPLAALAALALVRSLGSAVAARDGRQVRRARARLREAVADLKDSTRFERTRALLVKFDPETRAAAAGEARAALAAEEAEKKRKHEQQLQMQQRNRLPAEASSAAALSRPRWPPPAARCSRPLIASRPPSWETTHR